MPTANAWLALGPDSAKRRVRKSPRGRVSVTCPILPEHPSVADLEAYITVSKRLAAKAEQAAEALREGARKMQRVVQSVRREQRKLGDIP